MTVSAASLASLALAFARSSAFAATVPVAGSGAVPRTVRAALALGLVPAVLPGIGAQPSASFAACAREALIGAAFGLAAAVVAAAASAAGALVDSSLALRPSGRESVFGGMEGPFGRLFSLAFAMAFVATGALTHECTRFAGASSAAFDASLRGAAALARASFETSLDLAAPAIAAQFAATIVAAIAARAAPRINGLMLASPLASAMVLVAMVCGAPATMRALAELARRAASASPL